MSNVRVRGNNMKEFRIFYIVLLSMMFVMCFVYQSRVMPILLLVLIICPVFSLVVMAVNFIAIRLNIAPVEIITEKTEEAGIGLSVRNRFIFPVSPVRIIGDFQSAGETDFSRKILMTDIHPLSSATIQLPFHLAFRGEYTVRIYEVCVYDLLKLFRLRRKLDLSAKIIVVPREKTPGESVKETETDSESPVSVLANHRGSVFDSLREYREGDSIRHIHWKLSAKQDELIVKQPEQSVNNSAVIFCDFSADLGDSYLTRRMIDAVLETSLAITKRILLDGSGVINCWQGASGSEKYEATEFSHYGYLYETYTVLPQEPSGNGFDELITLFSPEIKEQHTIYVITPEINDGLLRSLEESGLAMRKGVALIVFEEIKSKDTLLDYIKEKTKIKLIEIDDRSAVFNIE